jgi:hypothetical protein
MIKGPKNDQSHGVTVCLTPSGTVRDAWCMMDGLMDGLGDDLSLSWLKLPRLGNPLPLKEAT